MDPFEEAFWNLCQAAVWVEFREKKLVRQFADVDHDAYRALYFYPNMWPPARERLGELSELHMRLKHDDLVAEGYRHCSRGKLEAIPAAQWHDIDLRPPLALDARPGHRGEELWSSVRVRRADMQKLWRSAHQVASRSKYDWDELRQIHKDAKSSNPEFSDNQLIEEIQLAYFERHHVKPSRPSIQRHMKRWG
jgi:hypothetical protein